MIAPVAVDGMVCKEIKSYNRASTVVSAITKISIILCFLAVLLGLVFSILKRPMPSIQAA